MLCEKPKKEKNTKPKKAKNTKIIKVETNKIESLKKINQTSLANMIRERQPYLFDRIDKVKFFRNIFSQN